MTNFFISYNEADSTWAEWIAWQLEEAGYTTILQAWDFRPSENLLIKMNEAIRASERTIAVLSPDYLKASLSSPEWASAFAADPRGEKGILLPVCVDECDLRGLFEGVIHVDLVGKDEVEAKQQLLAGVQSGRSKAPTKPDFPRTNERVITEHPSFPGTKARKLLPKPVRALNRHLVGIETLVPFFISYRRSDSEDITDRIYEHLSNYFGADCLFKDVDSIPPGVNFNDFITTSIKSADAMVVVIGRRWIEATDSKGNRRLEDPGDLVRVELETALNHGVPIIPVLVGGGEMPSKEVLPKSLQALTTFNAIPVRRDPDFPNDIVRLRRVLSRFRRNHRRTFGMWPLGRLHLILMLLLLTAGSALGIWWWRNRPVPVVDPSDPSPEGRLPSPEPVTNNSNVAHNPLPKPSPLIKSNDASYSVKMYDATDPDLQQKLDRDGCFCYIEQHLNGIDIPEVGFASVRISSNSSSYTNQWGKWYVDAVAREFSVPKRGDGLVIDDTSARFRNLRLPALRLEPLFLTNPQHAEWIRSKEGQERLAAILVKSIWRYFPAGGIACFSNGHAGDPYRPDDGGQQGVASIDGGTEAAFSHMILLKAKRILEEQK
jgi:TIR domain